MTADPWLEQREVTHQSADGHHPFMSRICRSAMALDIALDVLSGKLLAAEYRPDRRSSRADEARNG